MFDQLYAFLVQMAIIIIVGSVIIIASLWKIFTKAGEPGWASLVPIYNLVVFLKIIDKPVWWVILFMIPFVNIISLILSIIMYLELAKVFGKSAGFGLGLVFLPIIFFPILAFGDAEYEGGTRNLKSRSRKSLTRFDDEDEDEDDEDRPSRKRSRIEDDEDRPSRKRTRIEDDEDRPSRKRTRIEDDEDRPRRKRSNDDD